MGLFVRSRILLKFLPVTVFTLFSTRLIMWRKTGFSELRSFSVNERNLLASVILKGLTFDKTGNRFLCVGYGKL